MNAGWDISQKNFTDDDGSLPGIDFAGLCPTSLRAVVSYFSLNGNIVTENATAHHKLRKADVPLGEIEDPTSLVIDGTLEPFHCCFDGLTFCDTKIPILGLFVFKDSVEIDYRMGKEWTPKNVDAFFRLLTHLRSLAPEADVDSTRSEGIPFPEEFREALQVYFKSGNAEQSAGGYGG